MDYNKISLLVSDSINDLVYLSDLETYELLYINKNTINAFSKNNPNFEWKNQKCYKILQNRDEPCEFCTNKYLTVDKIYQWQFFNPITQTHYTLKDKLVELDGKLVRMEIAIDSTQQHLLTQSLKKQLYEQQIITSCIETLHTDVNPELSILNLLKIIGEYYQAERCYIFTISKDKSIVSNEYEWTNGISKPSKEDLTNIDSTAFQRWINIFETHNELITLNINYDNFPKEELELLNHYNVKNLLAVPLRDLNGNLEGFIGVDNPTLFMEETKVFKDLSFITLNFLEKNKLLNKLNKLSFFDTHSGLKNRNAYLEHIKAYSELAPQTLGVIVLDIKSLKIINDLHGYEYGDRIILDLATLLKSSFHTPHIYRLGGDEFVVLCEDLLETEFEDTISDFQTLMKTQSFELNLGYAFNIMQHDEHFVVNFNERSQVKGYTQLLLKNLEYEISNNKFTVYLQPQIDLSSNKVIGAEALIRKYDSKGFIKPPNTFLPFYEKESIISHIDYYVFKTICKYIQDLESKGYKNALRFSVNFSRKSLTSPNVVQNLLNICNSANVSPDYFIVEITETVTGIDDAHLIELINEFNNAGFLISLDDFGSGYSNLAIISKANFHEIKIDKTIIDTFLFNKKANIITKWSLDLCKNFNNTISVAEGVETKEQCEALRQFGCNIGQGYYFSKPIPMDEFFKKYIEIK